MALKMIQIQIPRPTDGRILIASNFDGDTM
jgi:hypothetical protein